MSRPEPRQTVASAFDPRRNSFGFLRIGLALVVFVQHGLAAGGFAPAPTARYDPAVVALGCWLHEHRTLAGYFDARPHGPFAYSTVTQVAKCRSASSRRTRLRHQVLATSSTTAVSMATPSRPPTTMAPAQAVP